MFLGTFRHVSGGELQIKRKKKKGRKKEKKRRKERRKTK
jgi:hypothetical protein